MTSPSPWQGSGCLGGFEPPAAEFGPLWKPPSDGERGAMGPPGRLRWTVEPDGPGVELELRCPLAVWSQVEVHRAPVLSSVG